MDKLKSLGSKIKFPSTPGEKLSKAFKFDRKHNVLSKPNDPFMDGPMLEDVGEIGRMSTSDQADKFKPSLPKPHFYIHCACVCHHPVAGYL